MNSIPLLYVEDEEADVLLLQHVLEKVGIHNPLQTVKDGKLAKDYLVGKEPFDDRRQHPLPGLVLLDLNLPDGLGLDLLKEGGYLAYVLPPSMNNGAFFAGLRKTIIEETNIEYMEVLPKPDLFDQALQAIMLLVLKKGPNKGSYIFKRNGVTIFAERPVARTFSPLRSASDFTAFLLARMPGPWAWT